MKHILGFILFLIAVGLLIFGLITYVFKSGNEEQKIQIKRALVAPPNLSIETIQGTNLPTQEVVDDESLLGIDSNHNEIRDDIELKVFSTYKNPVERALLLQAFRAHQIMLTDPNLIKNARYWEKSITRFMDCNNYLHFYKKQKIMNRRYVEIISEWQYNSKERVKKYIDYNKALSGGVYTINDPYSEACEFDIEAVLKLR